MINVCRPRILIGTLKLKDSSWPAFSTDIFSPRYLGDTWLPGSIYLDTWGILGYQVVYTQIPGVLGYQVVYTQIPGGYLATRQYIPRYLEGTWLTGSIHLDTWGYLATRQYIPRYLGVRGNQVVYTQIPGGYLVTRQYIHRYLGGTWLSGSIYLETWGYLLPGSIYLDI